MTYSAYEIGIPPAPPNPEARPAVLARARKLLRLLHLAPLDAAAGGFSGGSEIPTAMPLGLVPDAPLAWVPAAGLIVTLCGILWCLIVYVVMAWWHP